MARDHKLILLAGLFTASIVCANVLASKLFEVGGFVMTAGILAFPLTFLVTDVINDVWGRATAQTVVWTGLAANLLMVLMFRVGIILPPAGFWGGQGAFESVLGAVPRIVLASMVAYLISQSWDVHIFDVIKRRLPTGLWLRNNLSTISSQIIDSAIFLALAFGGIMPIPDLVQMFFVYVVVKLAIALLDTPLVYLGVYWVRGGTFDARGTRLGHPHAEIR